MSCPNLKEMKWSFGTLRSEHWWSVSLSLLLRTDLWLSPFAGHKLKSPSALSSGIVFRPNCCSNPLLLPFCTTRECQWMPSFCNCKQKKVGIHICHGFDSWLNREKTILPGNPHKSELHILALFACQFFWWTTGTLFQPQHRLFAGDEIGSLALVHTWSRHTHTHTSLSLWMGEHRSCKMGLPDIIWFIYLCFCRSYSSGLVPLWMHPWPQFAGCWKTPRSHAWEAWTMHVPLHAASQRIAFLLCWRVNNSLLRMLIDVVITYW